MDERFFDLDHFVFDFRHRIICDQDEVEIGTFARDGKRVLDHRGDVAWECRRERRRNLVGRLTIGDDRYRYVVSSDGHEIGFLGSPSFDFYAADGTLIGRLLGEGGFVPQRSGLIPPCVTVFDAEGDSIAVVRRSAWSVASPWHSRSPIRSIPRCLARSWTLEFLRDAEHSLRMLTIAAVPHYRRLHVEHTWSE